MKTFPVRLSRGKCAQFAVALTVALTACGPEEASMVGANEPASHPPSLAMTSRAAHVREVQAGAGAAYAIRNVGGVLHARHPMQGFDVEFGSSVSLRLPGDERLSLTTTGYGCEGGARPVAAAQPVATGNRVEYARRGGASGDLTEWYVHGPLGLEQGFTLNAPLDCGGRDVVVEMEVGGTLSARKSGATVSLQNRHGQPVARYGDLRVIDAGGHELPSELTSQNGVVRIRFGAAGAQYPVEIDPLVAVFDTTLHASNGVAGDHFGLSVAIFGSTAIATAPTLGTAYVFVNDGVQWTQESILAASDGEGFHSVALSGDTAVFSAPFDAAYVFERGASGWTETAKLVASDGTPKDHFGSAVAISGETILVGASNGGSVGEGSGAAYVFVKTNGAWTEQAKLVPSTGQPNIDWGDWYDAGDYAGQSVAVHGDTAALGAPYYNAPDRAEAGAVFVFTREGSTWTEQAIFSTTKPYEQYFGWSVSMQGSTMAVAAGLGRVYAFRDVDGWQNEAVLEPADAIAPSCVAAGENAVAFGDPSANRAFLFLRDDGAWTELEPMKAPGPPWSYDFGQSVALWGNTVLVGDPDPTTVDSAPGAVHVFSLRLSDGEPCTAAAECASLFCVDGVCCNTACDAGPCDACSIASGAAADGVCENLTDVECDDGDGCTDGDRCDLGVCAGTPLSCPPAIDLCHDNCDQQTGQCAEVPKPDAVPCDDGNACTSSDACSAGACLGQLTVSCAAPDECHEEGVCQAATGQCDDRPKPDDVKCSVGVCREGVCQSGELTVVGGCTCNTARPTGSRAAWMAVMLMVVGATRRSLRRPRLH